MRFVQGRALRVGAVVCLLSAVTIFVDRANAQENAANVSMLTVARGDLPTYAFAPASNDGAKPLTIYLHGICGDPGNGCPYFRDGATTASWLLCPSAPTECQGGGATWAGTAATQAATVKSAEEKISALYPQAVDAQRPRVLIGFSQGGYAARNLIKAEPGKFRAALFIGADIETTADEFKKAGISRVAFASGRYDMMRKPLEKEAADLKAAGFPTRFVDLGAVGHTYAPAQNPEELRDAIAWLEAAP
jgi:predicted esterase